MPAIADCQGSVGDSDWVWVSARQHTNHVYGREHGLRQYKCHA